MISFSFVLVSCRAVLSVLYVRNTSMMSNTMNVSLSFATNSFQEFAKDFRFRSQFLF